MLTFASIFAWIPIILAFRPSTSEDMVFTFWTMALLAASIELCAAEYQHAILCSEMAVMADHHAAYEKAVLAQDTDAAAEVILAYRLFARRGEA